MFESLFTLAEVFLLLLNALAILNEERFLKKVGLTLEYGHIEEHMKQTIRFKLIELLNSVRVVMRFPLIFVNVFLIIWIVVFG